MKIKFKKLNENAKLPTKAHDSDFCYDCYAVSREEIRPGVYKYGLGFSLEIVRPKPKDDDKMMYMINDVNTAKILDIEQIFAKGILSIDIRPRSSIFKTGMVLCNSVGTVDEDYRGEVCVFFYKVADGDIYEVGDRVCQMKVGVTVPVEFVEVDEQSDTERGQGGFGSSGK